MNENGEQNQSRDIDNPNIDAMVDMFFNANVLFCVAESNGFFSMLNPHWTEVLGWSIDELCAKPFLDFVHPDDKQKTIEQAQKQFVGHEAIANFVNRYQTKDGDYRWLEWTARSPDGDTVYAVAQDITAEKIKESELQDTQSRLQELVENVPGCFFQYILGQDGNDSMKYISQGSVDIWGLTPEEIGDDPTVLWEQILPEDLEAMQASVAHSMQTLSHWQQEYRIKDTSGQVKWLRGVGKPRKLESGDTLWNSLVMDLTEVREQQNTIAKIQRMDMIGHLAAGIAHDFNNILGIIDGHRQLLAMKSDDPELNKHIELMEVGINRAKLLTKRLLLSSKKRIEPVANKVPISSSLLEIRTLLDEVTPPSINVSWDIDTACTTKIDTNEFDDVITNIFVNATHSLDENGEIDIQLKQAVRFRATPESYIHMRPGRADKYAVLSITDNGCGIKRNDFEKIFIPFVSDKDQGTGLGLAMVVGFATRNDCGITLKSSPGIGTTISLWVPHVETLDSGEQIKPTEPVDESAEYHIVVLDDEIDVLDAVTDILSLKGHKVTAFSDSKVARQWLRENHEDVDLLLTDEVMPGGVQGHHLFTEFDRQLPVLIMTGYLDFKEFELQNARVLHKPLNLDTLLSVIHELIQSHHESVGTANKS